MERIDLIKEETKRKKLILQLGLVLILVLLTVISASAAITPAGNGVVTIYGDNTTEHNVPTYLNFTATEDAGDITSLNITCPGDILLSNGSVTLTGFENVSASNITINSNVVTISNGSSIIVPQGTEFSINFSDSDVLFGVNLDNVTYTFNVNTSVTTTNVPIYLTVDGEPSVVPVNYTQSSTTWTKNGTTLMFNASITDDVSGVQNATVDITSINASAGIIDLYNTFSDYWTNNSFMVNAVDGEYNLPVTSYDNASLVNNSVNFTVWVDNTEPTITLNTYGDTATWVSNGTTISLNATVDDGSGSGVMSVSVGGGAINNSLGPVSMTYDGTYWINNTIIVASSSQGAVYVPITATDNVSNVNSTVNFTVWVDNIEPNVIAISPGSTDSWVNNGSALYLNVSASDPGNSNASNISSVTVDVSSVNSSTTATLSNVGGTDYWINNSLLVFSSAEGSIDLQIGASDNASNVNNSVNLTLKVDNTNPVVSNESVAYTSGLSVVNSSGTVLLNFTATDATSGLNTSAVMINVSNLNNSLTWETMSSAGGNNFTLSVIVDNSSTGTAVVPISVADNATNTNTSQSISVVLDNSGPAVTGITPDGSQWLTNGSTIDINVSSTDIGDAGVQNLMVDVSSANATGTANLANLAGDYWTNSSLTVLTSNEGIINLTVSAYDNLSNLNNSVNLTIKVDNSAPVFTTNESVYPGGMNAINNGGIVTLNVTVTDAYSGVNASTVMVNASGINSSLDWVTMNPANGDNYTLDVIVNTSSSGTVVLPVRAADNLSMWNTSASISVEIDVAEPTVTPVSPVSSMWFKDGDVLDLNVTIIDTGTGVKNATVALNNVNSTITTAILEHAGSNYWINNSLIVDSSSEGTINLTVVAYDNVSNFDNSVNLSIKVDNTEPLVLDAQTEYATGYTAVNNGSTITLNATISDALSGVSSVMSIDNVSSISTSDNVTLTQVSSTDYWKYSNLEIAGAEGTYLLNVTASDEAGNVNSSSSATFEVIIDNTDPVIYNLTLSTESPGSYGESINVSVNVSDAGSGIKRVTAAGTALTDQGSNIWNGTISAGYGANTVTVVATDNASNAVTNTSLSYTGPTAPSSSSSSSSSSDGMSSTTREAFLASRNTYEGAKIVTQDSSGKVLSDPVKVVSVQLTRTEVTGVEVESEVDIEKISVSVQKLDSKPDNIPGSAPGNVHSYLNIEVSELDSENIAGASITFKVEKSWLEENGISTDDVVLSHYTGSAWDQLETSVSSDDGEYVYYIAKTPGFSTFAISTRSDSEAEYVSSGDSTGSDADSGEMESEAADEMPDTEEDKGTPGFGILLGIMGVSMVAALIRQKNRN
jgi:PGF-pre-PGF domain-containing protein